MIVVVDNGSGSESIANFVRGSMEVLKPNEAANAKASAFILSDGNVKNQAANIKIINKANKPLLGIGVGYIFLAAAYGAKYKEARTEKTDTIRISRNSPLTLDMKRVFTAMQNCSHVLTGLPENFDVIASSPKYEFKIIQETEKPFFGVHFNPELGKDGIKVLDNFAKFVDVWEKYHKG